jgi:hypothetical protein
MGPYVADELRQIRAAAREARLAGLRANAEAAAARKSGEHDIATRQQELAASYHALHQAYLEREAVFAATTADRADWDTATRAQRHLAVGADAELRRRHRTSITHRCGRPSPNPPQIRSGPSLLLPWASRLASWPNRSRTWPPRTAASPTCSPTGRA